ncbi:MAG TPA: TadE/TadG family type IV pilus assembly protein [Rhizomicrobium sp.]|jgi:Flp pilus assembly protein TadG|nr:TadE/TadG family type IV pilus assembly protein [Rhizomicrobium sp.]
MDRVITMLGFLQRRAARLRATSSSGSAAIEFAIVAPVLALFLFGIIETGVIYYANSALTNAADDTARLVRTGQVQSQNLTKSQYIAQICSEMTGMISAMTCNSNLQVDMESFNSFTNANYTNVINSDGSLNVGAMQFTTGNACDTVLVRAFYPWSIMTPFMKSLMQNMPNGKFLITSASAFRNEPYTAGASC